LKIAAGSTGRRRFTVDALVLPRLKSSADKLLDAVFLDDTLILFGAETVGSGPMSIVQTCRSNRFEGAVLERGIKALQDARQPMGLVRRSGLPVTFRVRIRRAGQRQIISEEKSSIDQVQLFVFPD
jgi:hypothetical protein